MIALLAGIALAADPVVLTLEGDGLSTGFAVSSVGNIAVNDAGYWVAEVDSDNPDTASDAVIIDAGGVLHVEGDGLAAPAGAAIGGFDDLSLNRAGLVGWNLFLDGTPSSSDDSGLFVGGTLLAQESQLVTYPSAGAGTPWIGFFGAKLNDTGAYLAMTSVDDPLVASSVDRALVLFTPDGLGGIDQRAIAVEGDILPGQTEAVADLGTDPHDWDLNNAGQIAYQVDLTGDTAVDIAVYLDGALVAQEGDPSPLSGRNLESLSSRPIALDDHGRLLLRAGLDGDTSTDEVILLDGSVVAQEGGALDGIPAPFAITSFGSGPVELGNNGNWVVYADWDDSDTTIDTGLFVNGALLVQEGTMVAGMVVEDVRGVTDGFRLSPSGRWLIAELNFVGSIDGAVLFDLADQLRVERVTPSSAGVPNTIDIAHAVPGHQVAFVGALTTGSTSIPSCPGEAVDLSAPRVLGSAVADSMGNATLVVDAPPALAGRSAWLQLVDVTACAVSDLFPVAL